MASIARCASGDSSGSDGSRCLYSTVSNTLPFTVLLHIALHTLDDDDRQSTWVMSLAYPSLCPLSCSSSYTIHWFSLVVAYTLSTGATVIEVWVE